MFQPISGSHKISVFDWSSRHLFSYRIFAENTAIDRDFSYYLQIWYNMKFSLNIKRIPMNVRFANRLQQLSILKPAMVCKLIAAVQMVRRMCHCARCSITRQNVRISNWQHRARQQERRENSHFLEAHYIDTNTIKLNAFPVFRIYTVFCSVCKC